MSAVLLFLISAGQTEIPNNLHNLPTEIARSTNYAISRVLTRPEQGRVRTSGMICRRTGYFGLAPGRARIEGLGQDGRIMAVKMAILPPLSSRADQRCGHFGATLEDHQAAIRKVRICMGRSGSCPAGEKSIGQLP